VLAREESAAAVHGADLRALEQGGPTSGARRAGSWQPDGTAPAIALRTEWRESRVAIVIEDHGIGIDPDHLSRMFDPYFTTKRGGTGLGLAIAKNIVEGLRGTIAVTSVPGVGTTIAIDLPADATAFGQHH
jgi:signal transduction histidine kinase